MAETFKTIGAVIGDTGSSVYECPASTVAIVLAAQATNVLQEDSVEFTLSWGDASEAEPDMTHLVYQLPLPAQSSVNCVSGKMTLAAGYFIEAQCDAVDGSHMTLTVLEIDQ